MLCGSLSRLNCKFVTIGGLPMVPLAPSADIASRTPGRFSFALLQAATPLLSLRSIKMIVAGY
ncbi:hypothetical protein J3A65_001257 [Rhizobium sp. PvP014]|nr:hypothetical protein [Rhizobium sp. PvP014]MBP2527890.1 hypothetical protein [Rhizobium sp. PvP099]